jgi:phosphate transport system substrate-binding protein
LQSAGKRFVVDSCRCEAATFRKTITKVAGEAYHKSEHESGGPIMRTWLRKGAFFVVPFVYTCFTVFAASVIYAEELKIGAGAAATENVFKKIQGPMETAIGLKLNIVSGGPVEAVKDLDKGAVAAAAGGLTFSDWMALMEKSGYAIPDKSVYKSWVIGKDIIRVIVNKEVTISNLSKGDLKGIFTGAITNWKQVTGSDLPIVVVWGDKIPGTQELFQKEIMGGEPYSKDKVVSGTAAEVKDTVKRTKGAVGLAPISMVDASVSTPRGPEVSRPITLLTKGEPSPSVVKLLQYMNGDGKQYLQ